MFNSRFSANEVKAFIALFLLMILVGFVNGVPFIFGDAYGYYHVGETVVNQGVYPTDVKPDYYEYTGHAVNSTANGYVTAYSVGQSILYYPFLTFASLFNQGTINNEYYKAFNGHSIADGIAVLVAAMFFAFVGIKFCYLFLKEIGFTRKVSFYTTLAVFVSLHLLSYTFEQPGYSHVYEFFAYSAFLYFFVRFFFSKSSTSLYLASIFGGLLVLIRITDAILILIPFLFVLYKIRSKKVLLICSTILSFFAAILLIYNQISYGNPLTLGYTVNGANGFSTEFNLVNLLFSDTRGLFIWSPLVLLAIIGLLLYSRKSKVSMIFFLLPSLLLIGVYNFWGNWWGGVSTGQRFFIVLTPVFALGVAYLYSSFRFKLILRLIIIALVAFSFVTGVLFRLTPVLKIHSTFRTDEQTVTTPPIEDYRLSDIYRYHARLLNHRTGTSDYLSKLKASFNGGRSILLLTLGQTDPLVRVESVDKLKYKVYFIPNNVNINKNANVFVTIGYKDLDQTFLISNYNLRNPSSLAITCTSALNCTSDKVELISVIANEELLNFAKINDGEKISVYAENIRLNYINPKLK